jgi:DNA invertase Pin-like site-specific DNA recombinase
LLATIAARQHNATLLIAKLDRLSRNAGFILTLRDSGVNFICCDIPDANTLTVGIFALIAQHERETISKRTKDALAAKKARREAMGVHAKLTPAIIANSLQVRQANAAAHPQNRQAGRLALSLHTQVLSLQQIAIELNEAGFRTSREQTFFKMSV